MTPGRAIKRSGQARQEGIRQLVFSAKPVEWLVEAMNGMSMPEIDENGELLGYAAPLVMEKRTDIAKFLTGKIVSAAPQVRDVDGKGDAFSKWVLEEAEATKLLEEE